MGGDRVATANGWPEGSVGLGLDRRGPAASLKGKVNVPGMMAYFHDTCCRILLRGRDRYP